MKRFYFLLSIACFLLLISCREKSKNILIPGNIIPKEKMARVITHIHIAEAEAKLHSPADSTKRDSINFKKIFIKDTITKQQYEESLTFYIDHPELLNQVYEQVVNELTKMQGTPTMK